MTFTGAITYRYFSDVQNASFVLSNFNTNAIEIFGARDANGVTGRELRFGISGIHLNTGWFFSFKNGTIFDPEGRAFFNYDDSDVLNLSGNVSSGNYDYYLNNELICSSGIKTGFDMNAWFVQCFSGASGKGDIYINGPQISTSLSFQNSFVSGGLWSGNFSHTNPGPLVIRSGELRLTDANQFSITGNCLSFNSGNNVVNSGVNWPVGLQHTGSSRTGQYVVGVRVYADFGPIDFTLTGDCTLSSSNIVSNGLYSDTTGNLISTGVGISGSKFWYYNTVATTLSGTPIAKPIYLEMSYLSGATGNFSLVTGAIFTNNGTGYRMPISVLVTPISGGYPLASGIGYTGATSGITGVSWQTSGYYTGTTGSYSLSFSSSSGNFATGLPLFSSAYVKTFSGQMQFITGLFSSGTSGVANPSSKTLFSGSTTLGTGESLVFIRLNYSGTADTANFLYKIRASGLPDSVTSTVIYSGSGLAFRT